MQLWNHLRLPALLLLTAAAGCGSLATRQTAIQASSESLTTGQTAHLAVTEGGTALNARWSLVSGENSPALGQGRLTQDGVYTAPAAVAGDLVHVVVAAQLASGERLKKTLAVVPGFLQLTPQNAALAGGHTIELRAQIAEVDGGTVTWSLPQIQGTPKGTLSTANCVRSERQYTTCVVNYTAPSLNAGQRQMVPVVARVNDREASVRILLNSEGISASAASHQMPQTQPVKMGTSGGNGNDYDAGGRVQDCCGGTLGALVKDDAENYYILGNNHVLAESDQGTPGDPILQPGLIDDRCTPPGAPGASAQQVGRLDSFLPLSESSTNADAALAAVTSSRVDASGSILGLGAPGTGADGSVGASPPLAGTGEPLTAGLLDTLRVAKSGRTTGLTCSTVDAVDLSVRIEYFKDCAETRPYLSRVFTGQIGVGGAGFTDSGDSGALVVDAANAQPVGLYFAGAAGTRGDGLSVMSPIGDVLNELGAHSGRRLSIAGTSQPHAVTCVDYDDPHVAPALPPLDATAAARAHAATSLAAARLMNREREVLGVAASQSLDAPGEPAVAVYISGEAGGAAIPAVIAGLRTLVIQTDAATLARGAAPLLPPVQGGVHLPQAALDAAEKAERKIAAGLMTEPGILGVGVAQSQDDRTEAALLVLTSAVNPPAERPAVLEGLRVRYQAMQPFHVTRSRSAQAAPPSTCHL